MVGSIVQQSPFGRVAALRRRALRIVGVAGVLGVLSLVAGCEARAIGADDIDALDGSSAETIAREAALVYPGDSIEAWYVNGTAVPQAAALSAPSFAIQSVLMQRAGSGSPSAIIITAQEGGSQLPPPLPSRTGPKRVPLYILNGAVVAAPQAQAALGRNDIQSIEIIKGPVAAASYSEPAAANGVVKITTGGAPGAAK